MIDSSALTGPPTPLTILTIGVTGHREIDPTLHAHVESEIARIIAHLIGGDAAVHETRVVSQLAAGADQLFAHIALGEGAQLQALLPFAQADYAASLPEAARQGLTDLLEHAAGVWTAPDGANGAEDAYHVAGQVMLAQLDVLIALWDGEPGRGIGGTAFVVAQAIREGLPVIHIRLDGAPTEVLWSQFDRLGSHRLDPTIAPRRCCDAAVLDDILDRLIAPPRAGEQAEECCQSNGNLSLVGRRYPYPGIA